MTATIKKTDIERAIDEVRSAHGQSPATRAALNVLAYTLLKTDAVESAPCVDDKLLRARMLQLAGEVAAARAQAERHKGDMECVRSEREKLRAKLVETESRNFELERQVLTLFGAAPGGADASIAEGNHTAAGPASAVGASAQAAADKPATIISDLAVKIDTSAITAALLMIEKLKQAALDVAPALAGLHAHVESLSVSWEQAGDALRAEVGRLARMRTANDVADQAAAAMAAESAQKLAAAERSIQMRLLDQENKEIIAHLNMVNLSWEVSELAKRMQLPAEQIAQLLVLAELRGHSKALNEIRWRTENGVVTVGVA